MVFSDENNEIEHDAIHQTSDRGNIWLDVRICECKTNDPTMIEALFQYNVFFIIPHRGHGGRVVTLSPPTCEARVRFPAWPQVGKLVVACRWSAVYSTEH